MTNSGNFILFLFAFLLSFNTAISQAVVYPGDVNNNGVVNLMDAIYLNAVLYKMGPQREEIDINWNPLAYNPWEETIPGTDDINAAFADCDGDGIVTDFDLDAIYNNYLLEHGSLIPDEFIPGVVNVDPKLEMAYDYDIIDDYEGGFIELAVEIQNTAPLEDLQAFLIKLDYDDNTIFPFPTDEPEEQESWLAENPLELLHIDLFPFLWDAKEFAVIRKNNLGPASGEGTLFKIDFIIIDDVIAYSEVDFTTQIIIEDARFVTDGFTDIPVVYDTLDILIPHEEIAEIVSTRNQIKEQGKLIVAPNPSSGVFNIITNNLQITQIDLYNSIGRHIESFNEIKNSTALNLREHDSGIYFLKCYSPKGIITRKIILQ